MRESHAKCVRLGRSAVIVITLVPSLEKYLEPVEAVTCVSSLVYNRLPVLQISMFRSSSQDLVAASGQQRPAKPSGALYVIQSTTTCCLVT